MLDLVNAITNTYPQIKDLCAKFEEVAKLFIRKEKYTPEQYESWLNDVLPHLASHNANLDVQDWNCVQDKPQDNLTDFMHEYLEME